MPVSEMINKVKMATKLGRGLLSNWPVPVNATFGKGDEGKAAIMPRRTHKQQLVLVQSDLAHMANSGVHDVFDKVSKHMEEF